MSRVNKSRTILHNFNLDNKGLGWGGLIFAAQSELQRIEQRATQLKEAIKFFVEREKAGDQCPGTEKSDSSTRNQSTTLWCPS